LLKAFGRHKEVTVTRGNILEAARDTIVSPANSLGFMDGGVDRLYTEFFGLKPQTELQSRISRRPDGHLPVGESMVVPTGNTRIPYMICAPTMFSPGPIPRSNVFYAMSAVLNAATRNRSMIHDIYCPGFGTGVGAVSAVDAATEMEHAYRKWKAHRAASE